MTRLSDEEFMVRVAGGLDLTEPQRPPARLQAKILSALLARQAETGPLLSLTEIHARGRELCVFEQLVTIAPLGGRAKSVNLCRLCHARVLAEYLENPLIHWRGCPYSAFKKS